MIVDLSELSTNQVYFHLTQSVIPRPVAWVLSLNDASPNEADSFNLAPFSYFTPISSNPPLLMISVGKKPEGDFKDTRVNIETRRQFVVHIAHRELAGKMTESSRTLPAGVSELDYVKMETVPFDDFPVPRLKDCRVAMACELYEVQEIGNAPQALIFGEIKKLYLDDQVISENDRGRQKIHADRIDPIGRLGTDEYTTFGEILTIPRPK